MRNHFGLDPEHEPYEFGMFVSLCTSLPCLVAIPAFYIAGVHYSWKKYHDTMFVMDVWNEMEQQYMDEISKKRLYKQQMQGGPAPDDPTNLSVSIDWKEVRQQRKLKVKAFKDSKADF